MMSCICNGIVEVNGVCAMHMDARTDSVLIVESRNPNSERFLYIFTTIAVSDKHAFVNTDPY